MRQLTKDVYVETKFKGGNVGLVITGEGAVLIDTPMLPSEVRLWQDEIAGITDREIVYVINTDYHGERILGNCFFPGVVVAHEVSWKKLKDEAFRQKLLEAWGEERKLVPPQLTFTKRMTLYLGEKTIELIHLGGHTPASIGVYIPQDRVFFAGEVVVKDEHPVMEEGKSLEWLNALALIRRMDVKVIVPGHGPLCSKEVTQKLSSYIRMIRKKVKRQVMAGRSRREMIERIDLQRIIDCFPMPEERRREVEKRVKASLRRVYDEMKEELKSVSQNRQSHGDPAKMATEAEIMAIKAKYEREILAKRNVVGLGIGYKEVGGKKTNQLSLVVMVREKVSPSKLSPEDLIPPEIEGVVTDVKEVGEIVALEA